MRIIEMVTIPPRRIYRSHEQIISTILRYLAVAGGEPVSLTRVISAASTSSMHIYALIREMENRELIKQEMYPMRYKHVRRNIAITRKGLKLLELLDAQEGYISDASWLKDNRLWDK